MDEQTRRTARQVTDPPGGDGSIRAARAVAPAPFPRSDGLRRMVQVELNRAYGDRRIGAEVLAAGVLEGARCCIGLREPYQARRIGRRDPPFSPGRLLSPTLYQAIGHSSARLLGARRLEFHDVSLRANHDQSEQVVADLEAGTDAGRAYVAVLGRHGHAYGNLDLDGRA